MERADKDKQLEYLDKRFEAAQLALCADYRGLTVAEISELRSELRKSGAQAKVIKNTLAKISAGKVYKDAEASELEQFLGLFQGPSFVVFSDDDPVSPAKAVTKFAKTHEAFEVKGGWFEGNFLDDNKVTELSNMPSREETLAKLLNLIGTPATQLVRILNAPASKLTQVLEAYRVKLEGEGK